MWLTIFRLFKTLNLKVAGIAGLVVLIFLTGWVTNGWRYKAKMEAERATVAENFAKRQELFLRKYREQAARDQAAAEALSADLDRLRADRRDLEQELLNAAVVKPDEQICNPFGPDFVRLWNGAGRD